MPAAELKLVGEPLSPEEAEAVLDLCRGFPGYRPSSYHLTPERMTSRQPTVARGPLPSRPSPSPAPARAFGPALAGRIDAWRNFVRTGGRLGSSEAPSILAARTNYFRATYWARGATHQAPAEWLLNHPRLRRLARGVHGQDHVVPFIVYANLMIPGQELGLHTDIPVFRGLTQRGTPLWLPVVMAHSGLFEDRRVSVATVVMYFGRAHGGEFAYYPEGPDGPVAVIDPEHNSAVAFDADTVFHGVDRVHGDEGPLRLLQARMQLVHLDGSWQLRDADATIGRYGSDEIRFSVSWKAYCFASPEEADRFFAADDALSEERILNVLEAELVARGRLPALEHGLSRRELAHLLIDEFVPFPSVRAPGELS